MRWGFFVFSLIPLLLLAGTIGYVLDPNSGLIRNPLAISTAILVCAIHAFVLIFYAVRQTRLTVALMKIMGFVSALALLIFAYVSNSNFEVHTIYSDLNAAPLKLDK